MSEYDQALSAFQASLPAEESGAGNQPSPTGPSVESGTPPAPVVEQASKDIDISSLPEEAQLFIRARERELQGDYTRKTQEVAEQRREAEQAMQFLQALNTDPNFAMSVLSQLQGNLAAAGFDFDGGDEYFGGDEGPDPYQAEIARLEANQNAIQEMLYEQQLSASLDFQLARIAQDHPDWTDQDQQAIIDLGFATGGDLMAAAEQYAGIRDNVILSYLNSKGSVNAPSNVPATGSGVTPPSQPKTEEELRAAALAQIRAAFQE